MASNAAFLICWGNPFHNFGEEAKKARSPYVDVDTVRGTSRRERDDDRSERLGL